MTCPNCECEDCGPDTGPPMWLLWVGVGLTLAVYVVAPVLAAAGVLSLE